MVCLAQVLLLYGSSWTFSVVILLNASEAQAEL